MSPSFPRPLSLVALALLLVHSACQRGGVPSGARPVSTGLDTLTAEPFPEAGEATISDAANRDPASLESRLTQSALDLEAVFKERREQGGVPSARATARDRVSTQAASATTATPAPGTTPNFALDPAEPGTTDATADATSDVGTPNVAALSGKASRSGDAKPAADLKQVAAVASNLASHLRHREENDRQPIPDGIVLTTLESLRPGVMTELEKGDSPISKALSREDRKELLAARDRVAANPEAKTLASDSLSRTLQTFAPPTALQIPKAAFCTRVQGFGRYDALRSETFLVNKPIRTLVYTELDGFTTRSARAGDPGMSAIDPPTHAVELSQSLTLYHDPSGLVAWQRPPQTVIEPCKAKRRDFFLVQRLDLPATLSIGKYNLKVRVTDVTSGAEAEAILPINVVADPALVRR